MPSLPSTLSVSDTHSYAWLCCCRCRQFPSLINCCTIDWFSDWPDAALLSVSQKFLENSELGSEAVTAAVAQTCLFMHRWVAVT